MRVLDNVSPVLLQACFTQHIIISFLMQPRCVQYVGKHNLPSHSSICLIHEIPLAEGACHACQGTKSSHTFVFKAETDHCALAFKIKQDSVGPFSL